MLKFLSIFFVSLLCGSSLMAQLPETQIYYFTLQKGFKKYKMSTPKLISFKDGYNNQPYFTPDNQSILFSATNKKETTDLYEYNIAKNKIKRLTKTSEAEYSPRYTPDNQNLSCVRVEDDTVTQNFVLYSLKGKKNKLPVPQLKTIGYYSWLNVNEFVAFVLPEPFALVHYNTFKNTHDTLAKNIGRSVVVQRNKTYYVDKSDSNHYYIKVVSREKMKPLKYKLYSDIADEQIIETLPGEEDFCLMNDGTFLMGHEGKLFGYNPKKHKAWVELLNLNDYGIAQFYRIACSGDNTKIAVVVYKGKKP